MKFNATRCLAASLLIGLVAGCGEDEPRPGLAEVRDGQGILTEEGPGVEIDLEEALREEERAEAGRDADAAARRSRLQALRNEGKRNELRTALSQTVLDAELGARLRARSLDELRDLNRELVFAGARTVLPMERVRVRSGDNLTRIANRVRRKHGGNVTPSFVMALNRLPNANIQAGRELTVPYGQLEIVVRKRDYRLYLLLDGVIVRDYLVGLGRDDGTPLGTFRVSGKTVDPPWRTPDGEILPFGHPDHLIGNRWMGFDDENGRTGYGIHGTVDEDSIGKQESDGCIRLGKADVEEIFRLFPEGGRVEVRL